MNQVLDEINETVFECDLKDVIVKQAAKLQDALVTKQDFIATVHVIAIKVV